jgi:hypothetical protein
MKRDELKFRLTALRFRYGDDAKVKDILKDLKRRR